MSLFSIDTSGQLSIGFGWNWNKLGGSELSERFRTLANETLLQEFSRDTWEKGWPRLSLESLVDNHAVKLKELVNQYVAEVMRLAEEGE